MYQPSAQNFTEFRLLCEQVSQEKSRQLIADNKVWIFGAGHFGRDVCSVLKSEGFDVLGFIESQPRDETVLGLPVVTWNQLVPSQLTAQLAIGIFNRSTPLDELELLARSAGFSDVFMPWDVYAQFGRLLGWRFWLGAPTVILDNLDSIERTWKTLADVASRQCFLDILCFRLGLNSAYSGFRHDEPQYFNGLTLGALGGTQLTYIDGGAYNGDTFLELAGQTSVSGAYLFEPDPDNYSSLVSAVSEVNSSVVCIPLAISDTYRILSFNAGNGEGGAISETGSVHIGAVALDEMFPNLNVEFIKLDVEGAEIQALQGARDLVQRSRPVLAISLYHRPQDIWEIPTLLRQLCLNYKFYVRQHYFNSFESVIYAVPESK